MVKSLPDTARVVFDDERAVANAGVVLPAVLDDRLGVGALGDPKVRSRRSPGAANPGRQVMTLESAMALGADCIDECRRAALGLTRAALGHGVPAPSTRGTFLRAFTFGTSASLTGPG